MNFSLPPPLTAYLTALDSFITTHILPLQHYGDNNRFFDHRREASRTQWDNQGLPTPEWEALLRKARELADREGFLRCAYPAEFWNEMTRRRFAEAQKSGSEGSPAQRNLNLWMAAIRFHLASHSVYGGGVSLANDLQNEHSVVGNNPIIIMLQHYGSEVQKRNLIPASIRGEFRATFGLTERDHGSDATWMKTCAAKCILEDGQEGWCINGNKMWQTGMHAATHSIVFARTSGRDGSAKGITAFIVPVNTPGFNIESYEWTLNMPTDHATVSFTNVKVPSDAMLGPLDNGLAIAQTFTHENRIRQAASSCGAAKFCVDKSIEWANKRVVFGKPLSSNQGIQFPLVELATQVEMLRLLIFQTAWEMDNISTACASKTGEEALPWVAIEKNLGHKIGMCNYYANRLACQAADRAIQVHGGMGYSRHMPFEHIWRHFRRYRITEGSEEVQMRKVAGILFGLKKRDITEQEKKSSWSKL